MKAKVLDRKPVHRGRVMDLGVERVVLPSGVETSLDVIRHPGAAAIVPITDAGEVLLIRQYRHAVGDDLWEIPAGTREEGEESAVCARRELEEEAGMTAAEWTPLGAMVPVPGYSSERIDLFAARGLTPSRQNLDEDEVISEVRPFPVAEMASWIREGRFLDAKSEVAIGRALARGLLGAGESPLIEKK